MLYAAVVVLLVTVVLGIAVDTRHNAIHEQRREIALGLERMQRHRQTLTQLLSTAVLERNVLRISGYGNTADALENEMQAVANRARELAMAPELMALVEESRALRAQEQQVIDLIQTGQWAAAEGMLFGDDYLRARKIYEINTEATVMAVNGELDAMADRVNDSRLTFTALRVASLMLLLWAGVMFSRRLQTELATQTSLRDEVSAANEALEERVTSRTAELQAANEQLERLSITDGLTGLYNRRHFDAMFDAEWQRALRADEPLTVLMLDVDEFKAYNDHYGHQAGDRCLQEIAVVLTQTNRRSADLNARYGGEEFVVLLPGCDAALVADRAERIRSEVELRSLPHARSTTSRVVTVSIGAAAAHPQWGEHPYALLKAADDALYDAKRTGRNRVVVSSPRPSSG